MSNEWGGGFSAGVATGAAMGRNQAESRNSGPDLVFVPDLKAERQLVDEYAARKAQMTVRDAIRDAFREFAPQHPLAALPAPGSNTTLGPAAKKIYDEVYSRIKATGLDNDPDLREICPGLTKNRDKAREEEAKAKAKAEAERIKAEAKAANPGFFKRLLG